ncbi:hypothetical protein JB92DRAFT_2828030 [Gautieria morchelliformis]|nr:hypothetical protein JB92DRAFT_2828030 [Gautieria morchelliformis]
MVRVRLQKSAEGRSAGRPLARVSVEIGQRGAFTALDELGDQESMKLEKHCTFLVQRSFEFAPENRLEDKTSSCTNPVEPFKTKMHRVMFAIVISLVLLVTVVVQSVCQTFGLKGYSGNVSDPLLVAKTAIYITQTLIGTVGNAVSYRAGDITQFTGKTTLSVALCAATGYFVTWNLTQVTPGSTIFQAESARLYSSALLALLIPYLSNSKGQYPALDTVVPLISTVFSLQISFGRSGVKGSAGNYSPSEHVGSRHGFSSTVPSYLLQAISVEISRVTNSDDASVPKFNKDRKQSKCGGKLDDWILILIYSLVNVAHDATVYEGPLLKKFKSSDEPAGNTNHIFTTPFVST